MPVFLTNILDRLIEIATVIALHAMIIAVVLMAEGRRVVLVVKTQSFLGWHSLKVNC